MSERHRVGDLDIGLDTRTPLTGCALPSTFIPAQESGTTPIALSCHSTTHSTIRKWDGPIRALPTGERAKARGPGRQEVGPEKSLSPSMSMSMSMSMSVDVDGAVAHKLNTSTSQRPP